MLMVLCGVLWALESIIPLYRFRYSRVRHAMTNFALTLLLVIANLSLSFSSAYLAGFSVRHSIGVLVLFDLPSWVQIIFGVLALDLFAYFAHVLLHKSWLGWQFHRVHHSENAVDVTTAFHQHPGRKRLANSFAASCNRGVGNSALGRRGVLEPLRTQRPIGACQHPTQLSSRSLVAAIGSYAKYAQGPSLAGPKRNGFKLLEHLFCLGQNLLHLHEFN